MWPRLGALTVKPKGGTNGVCSAFLPKIKSLAHDGGQIFGTKDMARQQLLMCLRWVILWQFRMVNPQDQVEMGKGVTYFTV